MLSHDVRMTPSKQIWPSVRYDDAPGAIRFLVDVCGFEERLVVRGDGDREIEHAQLAWPEGGGFMCGSRATGEGAQFNTGKASIYVVTDDPDAVCDRVKAAGAPITRDIQDEDYGGRGFTVEDPGGNLWTFGSYRGE